MTVNERVKKIRKLENLTMESFGEKLGVGRTAISNIEMLQLKCLNRYVVSLMYAKNGYVMGLNLFTTCRRKAALNT